MVSNLFNQLTIKPSSTIISVDEDMAHYSVYAKEKIHHDCWTINNNHYRYNKNILTRVNYINYKLALYRKNQNSRKMCFRSISIFGPYIALPPTWDFRNFLKFSISSSFFLDFYPYLTILNLFCRGRTPCTP